MTTLTAMPSSCISTPDLVGKRIVVDIQAFTGQVIDDWRTGHVICRAGETNALGKIVVWPLVCEGAICDDIVKAGKIDPKFITRVLCEGETFTEPDITRGSSRMYWIKPTLRPPPQCGTRYFSANRTMKATA